MWPIYILLLTCQYLFTNEAAEVTSPNILFILVDDLGSSDVSYNMRLIDPRFEPTILTPTIDHLADEGIKLSHYYTLPICGPSRSAILTSRLPYKLGNPFPIMKGYGDLTPYANTIASELKHRNYTSHFVGKWGVDDGGQAFNVRAGRWFNHSEPGLGTDKKGPLGRGFDTFYGLYNSAHNHYSKRIGHAVDWHRHSPEGWFDYPDVDPEIDNYSTHIFTRETIDIMKSHAQDPKTGPFFIHLSYTAPHDPLIVPESYENNPICQGIPNWRRKTFCGMVLAVDEGIGNITSSMKSLGLLDNTIIIFTTDNGGFWYVGGRNYPYRGFKGGLYEGGVHVPAFIHAPKIFGGGRVFDGLFHAVDWVPTLLSTIDRINGVHFNHNLGEIDGMDFSLALAEQATPPRHSIVIASDPFANGTAYIEGDYKIILGRGGIDVVGWEPDSYWTVAKDHVKWSHKLEESIVNALDWISVDLFPFAWSFHILFGGYRDMILGSTHCSIDAHPLDTKFFRSPNATFPIVLPTVQWKSPSSTPRVYLFNLKNDPFETNNIATQHPELVEQMAASLREQLKDAPPQVGAIHYTFRMFIFIIRITEITLAFIVFWTVFGLSRLRRRCTKNSKMNSSKFLDSSNLKTGSIYYVPS